MEFPDFSLIFSKNVDFPLLSLIWKRNFEIPWFSLVFPDAGHPEIGLKVIQHLYGIAVYKLIPETLLFLKKLSNHMIFSASSMYMYFWSLINQTYRFIKHANIIEHKFAHILSIKSMGKKK